MNHVRAKGNVLHCDYEKQSANGATKARVIEPLPPEQRPDLGKQLLMELSSGITRLPNCFGKGKKDSEAARKMRTYLDRRAVWKEIKEEALASGQKINTYSLRHRYAFMGAMVYQLVPKDLSDAMGHSVKTHLDSYQKFHDERGRKKRFEIARKSVLLS